MSASQASFQLPVASSFSSLLTQFEELSDEDVQKLITLRVRKKQQQESGNFNKEATDEHGEEGVGENEGAHQQSLLDVAAPLAASPSTMLLEGAPREFSHRVFFGLVPKWMFILALLFFLMVVQEFANTLAENAQRIQEKEFFTDGINCDNIDPPPPICVNGAAHQSTVDNWSQGLTTILGFAIAPIFGVLADAKGRRPLLILGMVMNFFQHLMYTLRWIVPSVFTYYYVVASQILVNSVNLSVTEAIISDTVPAKTRSMWLGLSFALIETADMILPQVSQHLRADIAFPAAMSLVTVTVIGSCFMPETLIEKYKSGVAFSWSSFSPVRAFSMLLRYRIVTMLGLAMFMIGFLISAANTLFNAPVGPVFPTSPSFQANSNTIQSGLSMFMLTVGQYALLRFFSQRVVMVLGAASLILAIIGSATVTSINQIYGWMVPFSGIEILAPIMMQILSTYVGPEEFGTAVTAIITLQNFGESIAAQLVLPLYFWWSPVPGTDGPSAGGSMHFFPQLLFSLIGVILCVLLWSMHDPTQGEKDDYARVKKEEKKVKVQQEQQEVRERNESEQHESELLEGASSPSISINHTAIRVDSTPLLTVVNRDY